MNDINLRSGIKMFKTILENVQKKAPLIHNITNYVTVNDCANILLACGASPIMADDIQEVEEITSICSGLNINIGTLNGNTIPSMFAAGKKANLLRHPVVLDPVGVGASKLRTQTAHRLIEEVKFAAIRGNISEIKTLALGTGTTHGVDANIADAVNDEMLDDVVKFAKEFAKKTGAVIAITGAIDIVADQSRAYCIRNGHPTMSRITGTGCQLSALIAAYVTANPEQPLESAAAAVCTMGLCGELAYARMSPQDGNSAYRNYIIDAVYNLTGDALESGAKYELR
jgi:hydroxyethylthiazole kinase